MNYGEGGGLSASDVALINGNGRNNDNFGGDSLLIFLLLILGFGRNGFGGFGNGGNSGGGTSVYEGYVLSNDFSNIERKIDGVYSGICDSTFALNNTITNGNASIQNTLTQGFAGLNNVITNGNYENRIATSSVQNAVENCCCTLRSDLAQNKYDNAQSINMLNNSINSGFVSVNQANCLNTRDIIDNQNNGTRAILDAITANRIEDKNAQIAAQQNEINSLRLAASQAAQNEYLLNSLRTGCPVNATLYQSGPVPVQYIAANGCNCNSGCGCNM